VFQVAPFQQVPLSVLRTRCSTTRSFQPADISVITAVTLINEASCIVILPIFNFTVLRQTLTILTYSMVQSPSWKADWFAARQEIPRISRNPKVHNRTHKRPPPVCILGQPNPVHITTSHLLQTHPNIIHPATTRSPQWSPSLRFPQQDPIDPLLLTHTRHKTNLNNACLIQPFLIKHSVSAHNPAIT